MFKRLAVLGAIVAALTVVPAAHAAPFLVGGVSLSSIGVGPGHSPVVPIAADGTALFSYTGATALDFTTTGDVTPGIDGGFRVDGTAGDFNVLNGLTGSIRDFTFLGVGQAGYPAPPIVGFEMVVAPVFSFDLLSVAVEQQDRNILTLRGTGLFHLTGYADTEGTFFFSANEAGTTLSYSASEATIPEAASLVLFGMGLLGLGTLRRRMTR